MEKTKYVSFHTSQKTVIYPDLKINNIIIDRVAQFNFLGLTISSDLKWHKHIEHIGLKISKVIIIIIIIIIIQEDLLKKNIKKYAKTNTVIYKCMEK